MLIARKDLDSPDSELVFKIAKNRYGRTGKVFMNWKGEEQKIVEKPNYYQAKSKPGRPD